MKVVRFATPNKRGGLPERHADLLNEADVAIDHRNVVVKDRFGAANRPATTKEIAMAEVIR
jgi:hypothetical protein